MAFDYYQTFRQDLQVGQCPHRAEHRGRSHTDIIRCKHHSRGAGLFRRNVSKRRNVVTIETPHDLWKYIPLCDGDAASFMGIISNRDCISMEIAKHISLNTTTFVRGLFETHIRGIEIFRPHNRKISDVTTDNAYVKDIKHGTIEMILLVLRYADTESREMARNMSLDGDLKHELLELSSPGTTVTSIEILRLSTAKKMYKKRLFPWSKKYKALTYLHKELQSLSRIEREVMDEDNQHHLSYGIGSGRYRKSDDWEAVAEHELQLYFDIQKNEHLYQTMCSGSTVPKVNISCDAYQRKISQASSVMQTKIHQRRMHWHETNDIDKVKLVRVAKKVTTTVRKRLSKSQIAVKKAIKRGNKLAAKLRKREENERKKADRRRRKEGREQKRKQKKERERKKKLRQKEREEKKRN